MPIVRLALACTATLALAAPAGAATLDKTAGNNVYYSSAPGEDNEVVVFTGAGSPDTIRFSDVIPITAGAGCAQLTPNVAECPKINVPTVYLALADGDNRAEFNVDQNAQVSGVGATSNRFIVRSGPGYSAELIGGPGPDELISSDSDDSAQGNGGKDAIHTGAGDDTLHGGNADDELVPSSGTDSVHGGSGEDTVSYGGYVAKVRVTLGDGLANDGAAGENDTVFSDVEVARGGDNADTLIGTAGADELYGGEGEDGLYGLAGPDRLFGENDADVLIGLTGEDLVYGGDAGDFIDGGADRDELHGLLGDDTLLGHGAEDVLDGGNGADTLDGGDQDDELRGNSQADELIGGAGADRLAGGTGEDTVSYATVFDPVTADPDGAGSDDGALGEGDTIEVDVERLVGGSAGDTLSAGATSATLFGGGGADTLTGGPAADQLFGDDGDDTLLSDDAGIADLADCGGGTDRATADAADTLVGCEPAPAEPGPTPTPEPSATPTPAPTVASATPVATIGSRRVRLTRRGVARVLVRCQAATCSGTLAIGRRSAPFTIAPGGQARVAIKLSRRVRRAARRRSVGVKAIATLGMQTTARRITVRSRV